MYIMYLIYIVFIILLFLASKWELMDHKRIDKLKNIDQIETQKDREIQYKFLAKFPYENAINWRMTYIISFFTSLAVYYVLFLFEVKLELKMIFLMFFIIFAFFHFGSGFHQFHFYRVLASKADTTIITI